MNHPYPVGTLVTVKWSHARHLIGRVGTVLGWDNNAYYKVRLHHDGTELMYHPVDCDPINEVDALIIESTPEGWFERADKFRSK